ncbi:class I SAM-dependent methyltransferase [Patescibacteria group bacterium]|nr:MAG: class I SAM-dependent methyltransferase [Patescibacteria group bacterium]
MELPPEFSFLHGKLLSSRVYPEFFPLRPEDRVLNAGFGDGPQALVYAGSFRSMLGIDVNAERLSRARRLMDAMRIAGVELSEGNVERLPVPDGAFDAALAIDIIEHVEHPDVFVRELFRAVAPGGRLLITFPAMHDRFVDAVAALSRFFTRRPPHAHAGRWHPDEHQRELPVREWRRIVERAGFRFVVSRATTMFPPLHLYGMPRFWFSNNLIHAFDRRVASLPGVQLLGQTVMAAYEKPA